MALQSIIRLPVSHLLLSGIRVTYSGLLGFVISISSLVTGLIFTLLVTRQLSPEEFGVWTIIGSLIGYFLIIEPVISYWSTRQIARNEPVGKTSITSSMMLSLGVIPLYLVMASFFSDIGAEYRSTMFLAALLIPVSFVSHTLTGINLGHKPHATSYGLLAFESIKIPFGLILVYFMDLGIDGAILATVAAFLGKIVLEAIFARHKIANKFNIAILYRWIKTSWIPMYTYVGYVIWNADVAVFLLITNSFAGVGFYAAAAVISNVVVHSKMISQALYPKLLAEGSFDHIKENHKMLFFFLIPMFGVVVVFSKPALFTLNPAYQDLSIAAILLATRVFFYVLTSAFSRILIGIENVDTQSHLGFRDLFKSKLFYIPTLTNIHHALYIASLIGILLLFSSESSDQQLVEMWAAISMVLSVLFAIYLGILVTRTTKISLPYKSIAKYLVATSTFMIVSYVISDHILTYSANIYLHILEFLLLISISAAIYMGVMLLIDKNTRNLLRRIIHELRNQRL